MTGFPRAGPRDPVAHEDGASTAQWRVVPVERKVRPLLYASGRRPVGAGRTYGARRGPRNAAVGRSLQGETVGVGPDPGVRLVGRRLGPPEAREPGPSRRQWWGQPWPTDEGFLVPSVLRPRGLGRPPTNNICVEPRLTDRVNSDPVRDN